jgi:hypothetical protein
MSAIGSTKQTCRGVHTMSAVEGRTDMPFKQDHFALDPVRTLAGRAEFAPIARLTPPMRLS